MLKYVVIVFFVCHFETTMPVRITIDCQPEDDVESQIESKDRDALSPIKEFCKFMHKTIPLSARNKEIVLIDTIKDQEVAGNDAVSVSTSVPKGHHIKKFKLDNDGFPKIKIPKVDIPKIKVPKLKQTLRSKESNPPTVVDVRPIAKLASRRADEEEDSSVERMERFKKGLQKMLNVVKVLGQIDQYLSERMRIVVDKLSKAVSD